MADPRRSLESGDAVLVVDVQIDFCPGGALPIELDDTGLPAELHKKGVRRVWIGGLAQDVCVRATVLEARHEGFDTIEIADGPRPITPANGVAACDEMRQAGSRFEATDDTV